MEVIIFLYMITCTYMYFNIILCLMETILRRVQCMDRNNTFPLSKMISLAFAKNFNKIVYTAGNLVVF